MTHLFKVELHLFNLFQSGSEEMINFDVKVTLDLSL